jgi:hypothetical protein
MWAEQHDVWLVLVSSCGALLLIAALGFWHDRRRGSRREALLGADEARARIMVRHYSHGQDAA